MTYRKSLEGSLGRFDFPLAYTEWETIAKKCADWRKRVTQPPFAIGIPFLQRPRGDGTRTPRRNVRMRHAA